MSSKIRLINDDCIKSMDKLISDGVKIDLILTDPPYGNINGLTIDGYKGKNLNWDNIIPTNEMFSCCEKLLRINGKLILFSKEPYTSFLRQFNPSNLSFVYPYYWLKNHFANNLICNNAPLSYVDDISVFHKREDTDIINPLRSYSKELFDNIGISKTQILKTIGGKADHFFRSNSSQFRLCTEETYNELINEYDIDKFDCFIPYSELKKINSEFKLKYGSVFNLPIGEKFKSNVLEYKKSYNHYHPTEKPVDLLEDLILTYTNENDIVLDFTMGSGSTGVACMNTNRNFIGIELDEKYFEIAKERIENCQMKLV